MKSSEHPTDLFSMHSQVIIVLSFWWQWQKEVQVIAEWLLHKYIEPFPHLCSVKHWYSACKEYVLSLETKKPQSTKVMIPLRFRDVEKSSRSALSPRISDSFMDM